MDIANGELVAGNYGHHSLAIAAEQVQSADPEYLIIAPCGFTWERAAQERPVLERYPWWNGLRAVRNGRIAFCDGPLFFNRSGMTITRTAEMVADILDGVILGERSEGRHWRWMRDLATR